MKCVLLMHMFWYKKITQTSIQDDRAKYNLHMNSQNQQQY